MTERGELSHHVAAIESDAGAATPVAFTSTLTGPALEAIQSRMKPLLDRIAPMTFINAKNTGADTSPLVSAGITGFGFVPDPRHYFDHHHAPSDTLDKVDPKALTQDTAAIAALAYVLAEEGL